MVTARYSITGVPLAQLRFARALAARGHKVDFIVGYVDPVFEFPNERHLNVIQWNRKNVRSMLSPLLWYLRANKPDVVFSAEDHMNGVMLVAAILAGSRAKVSGSSRVSPFQTYSNKAFSKGWFFKQLLRAVMWRADALTCVSKDMVKQYRQIFDSAPHICIYNMVDDEFSRLRMREEVDHEWLMSKESPILVAAGSLTERKGFADLIEAMSVLLKKRHAKLIILGEGPLEFELKSLVDSLDLSNVVSFTGKVDNPLKYFARADVSVLSSYAEGLPNVLIEAMMCGCTPVATDCPTGPAEVLQEGRYGYLVPMHDPVAMAAAIEQALDNPIPRDLLEEAVRPFEESAVLSRHFEVLGLPGQ